MRPLKLIMSAFGPYPGQETIDFTSLNDKNIFLVTGPTGAGKTTIFDAISYALFGEASGSSRDNDSLRSHFAPAETPTYVEMEFELRGERYRVKRNPKQEAKKLRGEGFTLRESDAELELPDGKLITQIKNVDDKVTTLLGINKSQFRQIVMLAQGEFRRLLEAESKEREVIFRKIFGTEAFQIIQMKLDNLSKQYYKKVEEGKTKRDTHVKHIQPGESEELIRLLEAQYLNIDEIVNKTEEVIKRDEQQNLEITESIASVKRSQEELNKELVKGEAINSRLKEKEKQESTFTALLSRQQEYVDKQKFLEKARKAALVTAVEEVLTEKKNSFNLRTKYYNEAKVNFAAAEENLKLCRKNLTLEQSKDEQRKKIFQDLGNLKEREEKVKAYEERILSIEDLKKQLIQKKGLLEQHKTFIANHKLDLTRANDSLKHINEWVAEKLKLEGSVKEYNLIIEKLRELRVKTRKYLSDVKEHGDEAKAYIAFEIEYLQKKKSFEELQTRFLKEQAGILALSLKDSTECPVCGSLNHPKPAQLQGDSPTEDMVKEAQLIYEESEKENRSRLAVLSELKGKITSSLAEYEAIKERSSTEIDESIAAMTEEEVINYINKTGPTLGAKVKEIEAKIKELLEEIKQKDAVEAKIKNLEKDLETKEVQLPKLETEYTEFYGRVTSEAEQLKVIEQDIPVEIRSVEKLNARIRQLENELSTLEKALKLAEDTFNNAQSSYSSSKADMESKEKNLIEASDEVVLWENNLSAKLKEAGFEDYEEFKLCKRTDKEIGTLDKEISEYNKELHSLREAFEKLKEETKDLNYINLDGIIKNLGELKQREEALGSKKEDIFARIKNNRHVLSEINKINSLIGEDEKKYGIINDISRAANGFNEERITFERYVLAAYFDEIISAANLRLSKMAAGRFVLKRKDEKGKGAKQEGLELEVFDNYTGKARHVKTLSGGEGFKASLALALGLADVVQAYAGGISLDTMFVDEGFGTLDPESLDHAIQCLIDLQKGGRLVGIISHVPELKERIDARLEVTPAKEGSKARFVV